MVDLAWFPDSNLTRHLDEKYPKYRWLVQRSLESGKGEKIQVRATLFVDFLNTPVGCIKEVNVTDTFLHYPNVHDFEDMVEMMAELCAWQIERLLIEEMRKVRPLEDVLRERRPPVSLFFAWYDLWIGAYWDRDRRLLYVCPLPMVGLCFNLARRRKLEPTAEDRAFKRYIDGLRKMILGAYGLDEKKLK